MAEIIENDKPQEKLSFAKDKILLIVTGIYFSIFIFLPDTFERNLKFYGVLLFASIVYFAIWQIVLKRVGQPFDFAKLLKESGALLVGLTIFYFLNNLTNFINESFSINIHFPKILSFLTGIAAIILIIFTFQIIEKYVKN